MAIRFTDLGERFNPGSIVDPRGEEPWVYLMGRVSWSQVDHQAKPCPVCGGKPRGRRYCLACDRTGLDGRISFPGLKVGQVMNAAWVEEYPEEGNHFTAYRPQVKPARVSRKVRRKAARQTA